MTEAELYRRCDELLGPYLANRGFCGAKPGEFLRETEMGSDRILVSRAAGSRAKTHFAVFMSYYPNHMKIIEDLIPNDEDEDRGFPCGPYLTPAGVMRREKYWSYRNAEVLDNNLDHILQCLDKVGLPWLESLRDPVVFAEEIDPVAALPAGYANEIAGNVEKAAESYREMLRRMLLVLESNVNQPYLLKSIGRTFVFVSKKLSVEQERCEWFQRKLDYYPDVTPLGT